MTTSKAMFLDGENDSGRQRSDGDGCLTCVGAAILCMVSVIFMVVISNAILRNI